MKVLIALLLVTSLSAFAETLKCELDKDGQKVFFSEGDLIESPVFKNRDGSTIKFIAHRTGHKSGVLASVTDEGIVEKHFKDGAHLMLTTYSWETYFLWCEIK